MHMVCYTPIIGHVGACLACTHPERRQGHVCRLSAALTGDASNTAAWPSGSGLRARGQIVDQGAMLSIAAGGEGAADPRVVVDREGGVSDRLEKLHASWTSTAAVHAERHQAGYMTAV